MRNSIFERQEVAGSGIKKKKHTHTHTKKKKLERNKIFFCRGLGWVGGQEEHVKVTHTWKSEHLYGKVLADLDS